MDLQATHWHPPPAGAQQVDANQRDESGASAILVAAEVGRHQVMPSLLRCSSGLQLVSSSSAAQPSTVFQVDPESTEGRCDFTPNSEKLTDPNPKGRRVDRWTARPNGMRARFTRPNSLTLSIAPDWSLVHRCAHHRATGYSGRSRGRGRCERLDPNLTNHAGRTALLVAASFDHTQVVVELLRSERLDGGRGWSWRERLDHADVVEAALV